ncbi:hypothetical protein AV530_011303 [Patagioenas fasciata monilis]|uniref:Uncharacterized protein n=1 Tax=Patagioenas fasciata monilis TaxID=372326 RepID=A0A1V4KNX7_PATFA|nr:hypothetical protein AV530_011303 [Patagioenas fasciata monilis]
MFWKVAEVGVPLRNGSIGGLQLPQGDDVPALELQQEACSPGSGPTWLREDGPVLDLNSALFSAGPGSSQSPTEGAAAWGKAPVEWLSQQKSCMQIPAALVLNFAQDPLEDTVWLHSDTLVFPPSLLPALYI